MKQLRQKYRYSFILLNQLVVTDFRLRYQGSFLGYVWSLLRPLALFAILFIVFDKFLGVGKAIPNFPVYLLLGIVLWNYFAEVTSGSVGAIVGRGDLLRKINFPKYVVVLAGSFSALINLIINFIVIALFMAITHVDIRPVILFLPLLVIELFVFALALAFFLSAAYVKFRDVSYIWEVFMQAAFYATPILYPLSFVLSKSRLAAEIIMLNPMAQIIQDARYVTVTSKTETVTTVFGNSYYRLIPLAIAVLFVLLSATYFKRSSRSFAENI